MRAYKFKSILFIVFSVTILAISGCTSIQLVSNYDETIDNDAQQLQKKLDNYFIKLQSASSEDLKYKNQQSFYEGVLADLDAMEVRANAIYKNKLAIEQINLAKVNFAYLVLLHKNCVTEKLTTKQVEIVKRNGVDLSMNCSKEYGATKDGSNKGDEAIKLFLVPSLQDTFNQQLGSIMKLELAKKRGESK